MRHLAVLTTGRQDWGILRSTCALLRREAGLSLSLFAGGMHCSRLFGQTVDRIRDEGFEVTETLPWIPDDGLRPAAEQAAEALRMTGTALQERRPEALLLVGDRFETAAAGVAATILRIPLIHLHGGEETAGAFDNMFRHALTKISHLHLVSHRDHADRVISMGEDPESVHVVGAPGLDNMHRRDLPGREALEKTLGLRLRRPVVVVTHHPATLGTDPGTEVRAILEAMDRVPAVYMITLPNADPGNEEIRRAFLSAARPADRVVAESLGERDFWGLLGVADGMLGNSSSGLIEASALRLPVVNVGSRQQGRTRGRNVIDVPPKVEEIEAALRKILSAEFRKSLEGTTSPYGDGHSAERIVPLLKAWIPPDPPVKQMHEARR